MRVHVKGLGVHLSARRVRAACAIAARVRCLPLTLEEKATLLSAAAAQRGLYGCAVTPYSDAQLKALQRSFVMALFPKHRRRCPEIVLTLMARGHRLDPDQQVPCECLGALRRMVDRRAELRGSIERTWRARQQPDAEVPGPLGRVRRVAQQLRWAWTSPWMFRTADGRELCYPRMSEGAWMHEVRDAARRAAWRRAEARRREYHGDCAGIERGIDRRATMALYHARRLSGLERGYLRVIIAGGVFTQVRLHEMKKVDLPHCPACGEGVAEDQMHIWWRCPAWQHLRERHPEALDAYRSDWPACL
eukprot:gene1926-9544_t